MSLTKDFFKTTRILDGGMGQELLNRGVVPHGTIWGATALFHKKYHKLLVKTHLDFIKAGAEIIVTNTFGSRKRRLIENKLRESLGLETFNSFEDFSNSDTDEISNKKDEIILREAAQILIDQILIKESSRVSFIK